MGSGGQKAHEAIAIAPAIDATEPTVDAPTVEAADVSDLNDLMAQLGADYYDDVVALSKSMLTDHLGDDHALSEHVGDLTDADLNALTNAYLTNLSNEDLQQLAAANGFEHPTLVGLNDTATSPLVHWLDPAYGSDIESKAKIQAKANERYQALQAGEIIAGKTLADVHADEAALGLEAPAEPWEQWQATPSEVASAMADVTNQATGLSTVGYQDKAGAIAALVTAENKLQSAACPDLGDGLDEMKASAAQLVSSQLKSTHKNGAAVELGAAGLLSESEARWLSPEQAIAAARYSTGPAPIAELQQLAIDRNATINKLAAHKSAGIGTPESFTGIDTSTPQGQQQLLDTVNATQDAFALSHQAHEWGAADAAGIQNAAIYISKWGAETQHKALSKDFRSWAKTQNLSDLRKVAETAGLHDAQTAATRAQVQSYLAGQWDSTIDQAQIEAKVKAKSAAKMALATPTPPAATTPAPPAVSSSTPAPATAANTAAVAAAAAAAPSAKGPGRFSGKLGALTAKLKAHQQVVSDLPSRTNSTSLDGHNWGSGQSFSKGSHQSSLHTGPDGSSWMFKPDKSANGARAHAESAASNIFGQVGVAGVDVHVAKIGTQTGAIQPLVKGASNISSAPSSWSQSDVDSMVRLHVAAWAVGDHDGHAGNVMRGPSGGVFAVDQGQAFKFVGQDRLDHNWHPPGNHGTPVYHQAYNAQTNSGLGAGVQVRAKAALPIIKAFEVIPDSKYRATLAATATEGVKNGVHWVGPMRKAAQKRLGTTTVTDADVATEFLNTAVDRKNNLRSSFTSFFSGLGVADAQHLSWVK